MIYFINGIEVTECKFKQVLLATCKHDVLKRNNNCLSVDMSSKADMDYYMEELIEHLGTSQLVDGSLFTITDGTVPELGNSLTTKHSNIKLVNKLRQEMH